MADGPKLWARTRNNNPDPNSELVQRVKDQSRRLNDMAGSILRSAGIAVSDVLMTITRGLRVEGTFESTGTANVGGELNVTGDAVFSGNLAVPNGSITNDALANPVVVATFRASSSAFAVGTAYTTVVSQAITVPDGFTKCAVSASAWWRVINDSAATGYINGRAVINSVAGDNSAGQAEPAQGVTDSAAGFGLVTGLTGGGSFTVSTQVMFPVDLGAVSNNAARISGLLFWFR